MMGGSSSVNGWELTNSSSNGDGARTIVLVGRTGSGKSATGNSIIGSKCFLSGSWSNGVTSTCELRTTILRDGQIVNVIDTPGGLFDVSVGCEFIGKEIVKCFDLAKDGFHAVILVFSVRSRFSHEEADAIRSFQTLFGSDIVKHMIVLFTGGDDLEDEDKTLEDYLCTNCPKPLEEIYTLCGKRCVLFDNKTKDKSKRLEQVQQLFSLVDTVVAQNGGLLFSNELFAKLKEQAKLQQVVDDLFMEHPKKGILESKSELQSHDEQLKRIPGMTELRLKEKMASHELLLAKERAAWLQAEERAVKARKNSEDEIRKVEDLLSNAQGELNKRRQIGCPIL